MKNNIEDFTRRLSEITGNEKELLQFSNEMGKIAGEIWHVGSTKGDMERALPYKRLEDISRFLHGRLKAIRILDDKNASAEDVLWAQGFVAREKEATRAATTRSGKDRENL